MLVVLAENIDLHNRMANGSMAKFKSVVLKKGVVFNLLPTIKIDGCSVRAVEVDDVQGLKLELQDPDAPKIVHLEAQTQSFMMEFPMLMAPKKKDCLRIKRGVSLRQFPINISMCRTVHKLQGKTLDNLCVNDWYYSGNWVYVVASRIRTRKGLFTRQKLQTCID